MGIKNGLVLFITLILGFSANTYAGGGKRLILNLVGTGVEFSGSQINHPEVPDSALCFNIDLINAKTRAIVGTATDCLSEIDGTTASGNVKLTGTTIFNLPQGTLITRGNTTVAPVEQYTVNPDGEVITHITGASGSSNAIIAGTKRFAGSTGTVRLSGMVNLLNFSPGDQGSSIFFDCIFVIDLD